MSQLLVWLPWASAGIYLLGGLWAAVSTHQWLAVRSATRCALAATALQGAIAVINAGKALPGAGAAYVVAILVAFLGWIIGSYASRYLRGEPGQTRFAVAYLATLAAVSIVVASSHLGVIIIAWAASSACLHHLLTYYRDRAAAVIVAHKKFLASRLAELLLVVAAILLYRQWGTLDLSAIAQHVQSGSALPHSAAIAAVLISAAVLLKCAQLPLHGWLIQVMEAPTPVSALLHAGVVNLGGYVLIRLAPLMSASALAQTLLVVVGSLTAVLAGVVMLTRITIKVRLAWSTCSQMGFMVMECGLGLYDLALLHLLAHSVYKAYAFLTAGEAVRAGLTRQLVAQPVAIGPSQTVGPVLALAGAWLITATSAMVWHEVIGVASVPWIATLLLACGLATLLWTPAEGMQPFRMRLLAVVSITQLYITWHGLIANLLGVVSFQPLGFLAVWSASAFAALFVLQGLLLQRLPGQQRIRLYDWAYAGFYLDEHFTRLTFRLWPARATASDRAGTARGMP